MFYFMEALEKQGLLFLNRSNVFTSETVHSSDIKVENIRDSERGEEIMAIRNPWKNKVTLICSSYLMERPLSQSNPNLIR